MLREDRHSYENVLLFPLAIRHPRLAIVGGLLTALVVGPGVLSLQVRTDGNALVPQAAPAIRYDRAVRGAFGVKDQIVVVIETQRPGGIYNRNTLLLLCELTQQFSRIDGLSENDVVSLATERTYRFRPGSLTYVPILGPLFGESFSSPGGARADRDAQVSVTPEGQHPSLRPSSSGEQTAETSRRLGEPAPESPQLGEVDALKQIRADVERADLFVGTLVSHDHRAAAILLGVGQKENRKHIYEAIRTIIEALPHHPERIYVAGAPVAESLLGTYLLADLKHLIPISAALMAGVFLLSFRSLWSILLPVSEVAASLVFVFGIMGCIGVPVYLTMAVLPVILTAIGVADEIHIFNHYRQHVRAEPRLSTAMAVTATMRGTWRPVVKTSITTALGFLSFALSPLIPVRSFGIFVALGILFCLVWSLAVIPAALVFVDRGRVPRGPRLPVQPGLAPFERCLVRVSVWLLEHRYMTVGLVSALVVIATCGVCKVFVQDSWVDGFPKSSAFYRASVRVDELFCGTHLLLIDLGINSRLLRGPVSGEDLGPHRVRLPIGSLDSPTSLVGADFKLMLGGKNTFTVATVRTEDGWIYLDFHPLSSELPTCWDARHTEHYQYLLGRDVDGFLSTERLRRMSAFEQFLSDQPHVGGVLGPFAYVTAVRRMKGYSTERSCDLPDDPRVIKTEYDYYQRFRGEHQLRQIVGHEYRRALCTVFLKDANYRSTANLLAAIREYEQREFLPHGERAGFAGDIAVSQTMIEAIVRSQTTSLILTLGAVTLIIILLNHSIRWGVCCVLPVAFAVLAIFGLMGLLEIPLGVATSMFAAMTVGVGVDYAIHLIDRWRCSQKEHPDMVLADAMAWIGKAISVNALTLGVGFAVMLVSEVPANARLGLLMVTGVAASWLATVLGLPAMARLMGLPLGRRELRAD